MSAAEEKNLSTSSAAPLESTNATDADVAAWKASFAKSNPAREKGELDKPDFVVLVLEVLHS
jgi:hypothetical protein